MLQIKPSFLPAIGWTLSVTVLLSLPGTEFPEITWLNKIGFDKWVHIGLFLVMVLAWGWALSGKHPEKKNYKKELAWIAILSFCHGIALEVVQHFFIPFRSFDFWDIAADGVGCFAGLLILLKWYKKNRPL